MSRQPVTQRKSDDPKTSWSAADVAVLTSAVASAPSVHNTQPWSLDVRGRTAVLRERADTPLAEHDPECRDRRISIGAALANLVLAVRSIGWATDEQIENLAGEEGIVARVAGVRRAEPTAIETQRYDAIQRRRSHRNAFGPQKLTAYQQQAVHTAATLPAVSARWISGGIEALAVARLLDYAARVYHNNAEYQRELVSWTIPPGITGAGLSAEALGSKGLGAVGLVTARTRLPDEFLLASRIERESVVVLSTRSDDHGDHVETGKAVEQAWLEATRMDLAVSVMTQPLHLAEVRTGLAVRLGLGSVPQMLMRIGYPAIAVLDPRRQQEGRAHQS